jgi:hypothetical protein
MFIIFMDWKIYESNSNFVNVVVLLGFKELEITSILIKVEAIMHPEIELRITHYGPIGTGDNIVYGAVKFMRLFFRHAYFLGPGKLQVQF